MARAASEVGPRPACAALARGRLVPASPLTEVVLALRVARTLTAGLRPRIYAFHLLRIRGLICVIRRGAVDTVTLPA